MHIDESEPLFFAYVKASLLKKRMGSSNFCIIKYFHEYYVLVGNVNKSIRMPFEEVDMYSSFL